MYLGAVQFDPITQSYINVPDITAPAGAVVASTGAPDITSILASGLQSAINIGLSQMAQSSTPPQPQVQRPATGASATGAAGINFAQIAPFLLAGGAILFMLMRKR